MFLVRAPFLRAEELYGRWHRDRSAGFELGEVPINSARVLPHHISLEPTIDAAAFFALFCGVTGATLNNAPEPRLT